MLSLKGLYEWKLTNIETGETELSGSQWNVISDRFINYMLTGSSAADPSNGYTDGLAILISDSVPVVGVDYRRAGASSGFSKLATGSVQTSLYNDTLKTRYCDNNFSPSGVRTIRVIGIKIYNGTGNFYNASDFVSFVELSSPVTQNANQYFYVRYTVYISFSHGNSYNLSNSRYVAYSLNTGILTNQMRYLCNGNFSYVRLTQFLPPTNINYLERPCAVIYSSTTKASYTGSPFGQTFQSTLALTDIPGPIGTIVFDASYSGSQNAGEMYYFLHFIRGYSQVKDMVPSISRIYTHPSNRDSQIFSDPSYPASSQGSILISGTPTNKYHTIGRIRITKTGDASDIIDETVPSTSVDAGADTITVAQDTLTADIYRFTSDGTLPTPLSAGTDYYIIRVDATTVRVATSESNALAGIYIGLDDQGSGNHTLIRWNTGKYRLQHEPWPFSSLDRVTQLSMAIDAGGYVMPPDLGFSTNTPKAYGEADYLASTDQNSYGENERYSANGIAISASMLRGTAQNGDYIYSVQQSRKGLINNVCRWRFNTIETSQALCAFGSGSTKVSSVFTNVANTIMYISTNQGLYEYTFSTPTVAPVLLTVTNILSSNITDACMDPATGSIWTGHSNGLSKIDIGTLIAVRYITGTGNALEGLSADEATVKGGQLDVYNGRVVKAGRAYYGSQPTGHTVAWVMDDGVGYYRVSGTNQCTTCGIRKGTTEVVYSSTTAITRYNVVVTGKNAGSSTSLESFSIGFDADYSLSHMAQFSDSLFTYIGFNSSSNDSIITYKVGSGVRFSNVAHSSPLYGSSFGWSLGALKRNQIDIGGGVAFVFWHTFRIYPVFPTPIDFGWDGSTWVKGNPNSRYIPKTATHPLLNGLSVDFNNATGTTWDDQFVNGESTNFVHGPFRIKDNLQQIQLTSRNYACAASVVENYPITVPAAPYTITIPEVVDPNFRDLDSNTLITEVYEGATRYTMGGLPTGTTFASTAVNVSTNTITIGINIATGTCIQFTSPDPYLPFLPFPLQHRGIYYAINVNATSIRVAATYADALAGTAIDIINQGDTVTNTLYPLAPATNVFYAGTTGVFLFSSADVGKNLTLTYTYTRFSA